MNENKFSEKQVTNDIVLNSLPGNDKTIDKSANNFSSIEERYGLIPPKTLKEQVKGKHCSSSVCLSSFFTSVFPIISWLPKYKRSYILPDIISGFTVAILHIPQGLAYGVLASVKPENGLYLSIFPVIIYFILGTTRHVSVGTFSIISLMVSSAVFNVRISDDNNYNFTTNNSQATVVLYEKPPSNLEIVVCLALTVGIIQLIMGIAHLGTLAVLLSDQLVSGFCMGAAFHVAVALIPEIFGLTLKRYTGSLKIVYACIDLFYNISQSNVASVITTAVAIFILAAVKDQVNDRFKAKMMCPVPIDIIVVIIGTVISYVVDLEGKYNVKVIGNIPTGLPSPVPPRVDLMMSVLKDAFAIAIVIYVTTLSIAKLFAKKYHYTINPNQELIAFGCANIFSSFFSCFPCSAALARSSVQEKSGCKTQVTSLVSVCIMLLVTLVLAPLFYSLPRCILSAVILVALKGLFLQGKEFVKAWKLSKIDAMIWLVTMVSTGVLNVTYGLLIGLVFAILTVILRTAFPSSSFLGIVEGTNIYLDVNRFQETKEIKGMKIFRFESALNYINRENFKNTLLSHVPIVHNTDGNQDSLPSDGQIHHIILDCSSFSYIDVGGLDMLQEIIKEYADVGITVSLAGCSVSLWDILKRRNIFGNIARPPIFPTIEDAIQFCDEL